MSMLTVKVENLRIMARLVRDYDYREISRSLRDAADTIADLRETLRRESDARMDLQRDYNNQIKRIRNQRKQLRELQAALMRETCHDTGDERVFCCSECGFGLRDVYFSDEDYLYDDCGERIEPWPPFCPNCGRRVVE